MVEFALVIPILCMIVLGGLQVGVAYFNWQQLSSATSEGARKAVVSRSDSSRTSTVTNAVKNAAPNLTASDINVSVSSTWTPGSTVTVTATYPYSIALFGVPVKTGTLSNTRSMRVEQ